MFPRLGVAKQITHNATSILSERVGAVVLCGDAEIGFQQVTELLLFKDLGFVGPLPDEVQQRVFFLAGIAAAARWLDVARHFVRSLASLR